MIPEPANECTNQHARNHYVAAPPITVAFTPSLSSARKSSLHLTRRVPGTAGVPVPRAQVDTAATDLGGEFDGARDTAKHRCCSSPERKGADAHAGRLPVDHVETRWARARSEHGRERVHRDGVT